MTDRPVLEAALRVGVGGAALGLAAWAGFAGAVGPEEATEFAVSVVGFATVIVAAYACNRAAQVVSGDATAWRLMAAGLAAFSLSAAAFSAESVFGLSETWLDLSAAFGLIFRLLAVFAMASFPIRTVTTRSRWRARLDLLVVVAITCYLAWGWVLSDLFDDAQGSPPAARAAVFSLLDIALVIIVLMASLRRPAGDRDAARLVGGGLLLLAAADWSVGASLSSGLTHPSVVASIASLTALSLIAAGAWLTVHPTGEHRRPVMNARRTDLLPVLLAAIALTATIATGQPWEGDPLLLVLAITSAASLLAWQVAVVFENEEMVESLSQQRRRFETLIETAPIAIIETDVEGHVQVINSEAARLLGVEPGSLVGSQSGLVPMDAGTPEHAPRERVLGGETLRDLRVPLRRADGKALEMLVSAAPIRDRAEGISRIVWIGSDDGPRLRGLAAMIDVQRMQAFEQLISGIAHDFNNRLTVIAGTTEILLQEERSADDREMLSSVLEAGRRAAALVDQLVSTTRRGYDDQRHLDLRVLLDQLEPELIRRTPRGATIRVESGHVRLPVEADRADLEQAVLNLVTNAFESLGAAGAVEVRARRLDDESRADHRVVELTVTDDGTGMDRATRGRALEPFFSTKAGGGRSRGLGLPAVQGVVLRSQGELVLESEEGRGTTVTVHLPLREPPEADRRAAPREVTRRDRPAEATILLVDDEPEVRAVAHRVLVAAGYAVIEASHAEEALAILTAPGTDIDLLLSDIVMPGRSGIELAHDFTEHHPQRPVLLLSGFVGESAPGGRAAAVPFPLLPKPITREDLLAAVAEALPAPS